MPPRGAFRGLSTGLARRYRELPNLRQVDETVPVIEGLRIIERTQESGPGEVWRARILGGLGGAAGKRMPAELAGVGECEVRLLRLPVEQALRDRAHSVARELVSLTDPGLVGVREVRTAYDGVALVLAALPTPMLGLDLLARRRQLSAGELVTLGVAISWALAAAHSAGVTHGRLRDADVLLDPGGRPMLAGVGVMGVLGSAGDPVDDVRGLVRMLLSLLNAESPGASKLTRALEQPVSAASELAAVLAAACAAAPIRLADSTIDAAADAADDRPRVRRRRASLGGLLVGALGEVNWRRATRLAGIGAGILVLAGIIGWVSAPGPAASATPGPAASGMSWPGVLAALDAARAKAFAAPGTIAISTFDAAGSEALRYDTAAVASLRTGAAHATGLRMLVSTVSVKQQSAREVTLSVTDSRSAYVVRGAQQQVLSQVAARAPAEHLVVLRSAGEDQWRIAEVKAAP
jgi:hypothetical protein